MFLSDFFSFANRAELILYSKVGNFVPLLTFKTLNEWDILNMEGEEWRQ